MRTGRTGRLAGVFLGVVFLAAGLVSAQEVEYYHLDAIGNVRAVTDAAGRVIERQDYQPFGEEWLPQGGTQPLRFTGKERDAETGLDYFGARYYGSKIGRFTTTDPVQTIKANLVDPQRWNRYAYARNNPLRYNDPTGAVLELTGENREKAFGVLEQVAGSEGRKLLGTRSEGGRTFVQYSGKGRDSLAATSQVGVYLADIIDSEKTTEFSFATTFTTKHGTQTTAFYGGAATVGMEESLNGNTQVFLNPDAANIMYGISHSLLGRAKSSGGPLPYTDALIAGHELGHAWANLRGDPLYMSNASNATALRVENLMRARMGLTDTRVFH